MRDSVVQIGKPEGEGRKAEMEGATRTHTPQ